MHISVGSASHVLALNTAAYPNSNVYVLNATQWQPIGSGWLTFGEVGPDGSIWGVSGSTIYTYTGSWNPIAGSLNNIAVGSASVWGVNSSNQLFKYVGGSAVWQGYAPPFTPSSAENAIATSGDMALTVLDTSGGIHVSTDAGGSWSTIKGTASSITGTAAYMFVRDSSGVSYHVNLMVPQLRNSGTGAWSCPPQGCPAGSYHTVYATAYFGGQGGAHGTAGVTGQAQGYPQNLLDAEAVETGANCDLIFGNPNQAECFGSTTGRAICSVMGMLGSTSLLSTLPFFGVAETLVKNNSGANGYGCYVKLGVTHCNFNVSPNCTAATSPPVYAPSVIDDSPIGLAGWWTTGTCVRLSTSSLWSCYPVPGAALKTTQTTPGNCVNP